MVTWRNENEISSELSAYQTVLDFKRASAHQKKSYNKTYATTKDSDQPMHAPNIARVLVYPSLYNIVWRL